MNSDILFFRQSLKTIPIENMRIANLTNFLKSKFENSIKFILKSKKNIIVSGILMSTNTKEILAAKSMIIKRGCSITHYIYRIN